MRFVLLHYHILKNAGSTIEEILHHSFGENLCRFDTPDRDGVLKNTDLIAILQAHPNVTAFSSHQIYYPVPQAHGFLFFDLCALRDPIDRIRSIYDYFRKRPSLGDPMSDLANQRPLGEFTRYLIDNWPWTVNDVQVNLLANGLVNDQPIPGDLEKATQTMLEVCYLAVVDRFNQSLVAIQHDMRTIFPASIHPQPAVNISGTGTLEQRKSQFKDACEPAVFTELLRLNEADFTLLDRARAEVQRRFDLVPNAAGRLRQIETGGDPNSAIPVHPQPPPCHPEQQRGIAAPDPSEPSDDRGILAKLRRKIQTPPPANPLFDPDFYLNQNPDVRESGMNPLLHYELHGAAEGRKPHPLFDPGYYLAQCPEASANPLSHFLKSDPKTRKNPHLLFNCEAFSKEYSGDENPLVRYLHAHQEARQHGARPK
jgi:hypothetical protein